MLKPEDPPEGPGLERGLKGLYEESGFLLLGRNGSTGGCIVSTFLWPSALCFSIIGMRYLVTAMLRPSIAAKRTPPTAAFLPADFRPPLIARMPNINIG